MTNNQLCMKTYFHLYIVHLGLSGSSKNSGNISLFEKWNETFIFLSYHIPYISIGLKENSGNSIVSHENIEKCA